ncbi:MAG TPA: DUF3841 domain-containing protein [Nocardioidaceae bacterium]|nr:DUF3841 domain-containing protein [Nocardioidaceae bacterium]
MLLPGYPSLPRRPPWWAVNRVGRRWLGDIGSDPLRLWTFQSEDAYRQLAATGSLVPLPEHRGSDFVRSYEWMEQVAGDRLTTDGPSLLWLWARVTRADLCRNAQHARGDVLLELLLPRSRVVLSHYDEWHSVLNESIVVTPRRGVNDDEWWARTEPLLDAFRERLTALGLPIGLGRMRSWPDAWRREVRATWPGVLDQSWWKPTDYVQAVTHQLHADDVVQAVRITGTRSPPI